MNELANDRLICDMSVLAVVAACVLNCFLWLLGARIARIMSDRIQFYFPGDLVLTDFGRGRITEVVRRGDRKWSSPVYYWVDLPTSGKQALLAGHELLPLRKAA